MSKFRTNVISPIPYTGGKIVYYPMVKTIINKMFDSPPKYAEPFAGGCGLSLRLLDTGVVSEIYINEYDKCVWSFWHTILHNPNEIIRKIENADITVDEWRKQREIYINQEGETIDLGYSVLFLSVTSMSAVLGRSGVRGGFKQNGKFKIDSHWRKNSRISRIWRINKMADRIHLSKKDATKFIEDNPKWDLMLVDPPYYKLGNKLYFHYFNDEDHISLKNVLKKSYIPWILCYNKCDFIDNLYQGFYRYESPITHFTKKMKTVTEILYTNNIELPENHASLRQPL